MAVVELIREGRVDLASELFHYPESYSEVERSDDAEGVATSLATLLELFGKPGVCSQYSSALFLLGFSASGH